MAEAKDSPKPATEGAPPKPSPPPRKPRRPLPSPLAVIVVALGLFLVVLTLLAIQVRTGHDPALGPGPVIQVVGKGGAAKGAAATSQATAIVSRTSPAPPP
jgi:hypothetical protein